MFVLTCGSDVGRHMQDHDDQGRHGAMSGGIDGSADSADLSDDAYDILDITWQTWPNIRPDYQRWPAGMLIQDCAHMTAVMAANTGDLMYSCNEIHQIY